MQSVTERQANSIIQAGFTYAGENAKISTIGWCFGGGWSLKTAIKAEENAKACVMFYGMPVKDVQNLKPLSCDVLFIYGEQDNWIDKEVADNFKNLMQDHPNNLEILSFDADHAFANPTGERYVESAAVNARQEAVSFLRKHIR